MEWIEIMLLSIGCLMIVVAIHTVATYPNRLLRLREQAAIAAAEYRIAVLVYWKEHPPSLDAIPFTFILRRVNEARIIPACAGNRGSTSAAGSGGRDHPRVCREQFARMTTPVPSPGSSPRVQGTDRQLAGATERTGIIPACAGNRSPLAWQSRLYPDHPRVCREQQR